MLKFWPNRFLGHKASFISYTTRAQGVCQNNTNHCLADYSPALWRALFSHVGRNDITCLRCWFTTNVIIKLNGRKTFSKSLNWTEPMCKCRKSRISFVSRCPSWRTQALKAIIWQRLLPSAHSPLVWLPVIEPRTVVGRKNQHHCQYDINFRRRWRFFGNDSTDPWTRGLCDLRSRKSKNLEI